MLNPVSLWAIFWFVGDFWMWVIWRGRRRVLGLRSAADSLPGRRTDSSRFALCHLCSALLCFFLPGNPKNAGPAQPDNPFQRAPATTIPFRFALVFLPLCFLGFEERAGSIEPLLLCILSLFLGFVRRLESRVSSACFLASSPCAAFVSFVATV